MSFHINVPPLLLGQLLFAQIFASRCILIARSVYNLSSSPPPHGILKEGANSGLYFWGEKVALDCGNASRRLSRDNVDAYHAAVGLCTIDRYLRPRAWCIALDHCTLAAHTD